MQSQFQKNRAVLQKKQNRSRPFCSFLYLDREQENSNNTKTNANDLVLCISFLIVQKCHREGGDHIQSRFHRRENGEGQERIDDEGEKVLCTVENTADKAVKRAMLQNVGELVAVYDNAENRKDQKRAATALPP